MRNCIQIRDRISVVNLASDFLRKQFEVGDPNHRVLPMEGIRGFAALLVFFVHYAALFNGYLTVQSTQGVLVRVAGTFGNAGVDVFFVLSAFLVYGIVFKSNPHYGHFVTRRVHRLYPTFLLILLLTTLLSLAIPSLSKLPNGFARAWFDLAANVAMLPGMINIKPIVTVAWSLSYEWFFYLTIPLVISGLSLRRWRSRERIAFFAAIGVAEYLLCLTGSSSHGRLIMFVAGIILWEMVNFQGIGAKIPAWGEVPVILLFTANLLLVGVSGARLATIPVTLSKIPYFYAPLLFVTVTLLILYSLYFDGILKLFFSWQYLRWLGNMSYSYYLAHGLVLHGIRFALGHWCTAGPRSNLFGVALLLTCIVSTVLCASLLFIVFEKPLSLSSKDRRGKRSQSDVVLTHESASQEEVNSLVGAR